MCNELAPYECIFNKEERKKLTAQMLKELRTAHNYTQKQVSAFIKVESTTYSTYESGRTEPPIEILVRLAYLYKVPVDMIVQKDRLYRTTQDLKATMEEAKKELENIEDLMKEDETQNEVLIAFRDTMLEMIEQLKGIATENKEVVDKIDKETE